MCSYVPPPFPAGLKPGRKKPSAKTLQAALKVCGYMSKLVPFSDNYGPMTEAAVRRFHAANRQFGGPADPVIGPRGWAFLMKKAYAPKPPGEPTHDYSRVRYGGRTVNIRTRIMLQRAEALYGSKVTLTQGSYNKGGVAASAGTHDGGGVVDISVLELSSAARLRLLRCLREAGFAAWLRTPAEGFVYHIHACAIGDREMAPLAKAQVRDYFNGRNGLASHGPDTAPASVGRPIPWWAAKYEH